MELNEKIKRIRLERRLKQDVVANELNITQSYYSHMERATRGISLDIIERLAIFYNLTIEEVIHYGENKEVEEARRPYQTRDNSSDAIVILRNLEQGYYQLEREVALLKMQIEKIRTNL